MSKELQHKHPSKESSGTPDYQSSTFIPKIQSKIKPNITPTVQAKLLTDKEKPKEKKNETPSTTKLPEDIKAKMEKSFGHDFSNVVIHQNSSKAENINAKAYAQGTDIHFAPGQYNPTSQEGQELLGHEFAHVVQQNQGKVGAGEIRQKGLSILQDSGLEKEADEMGKRAANGQLVAIEGVGQGIQKQDAPAGPTKEQLDEIEKRYNDMVAAARVFGFNVAADNLDHFLKGGGKTKTISSSWLRGYGEITSAEEKNQERFQESLTKKADAMKDGETKSFSDYWDRSLYARGMNELFYASGGSTITSKGTFTLTKKGEKVTVTGTVNHHWHDPYDWHEGLTAFVPGYGNVSDADALLLQTHRGASPFEMISDWEQTVSGTVETDRWTDYFGTDFSWKMK